MENEAKGRFYLFNDKELYMLKRACVEAAKYLWMAGGNGYTDYELETLSKLTIEVVNDFNRRIQNGRVS